MESEIHKMVISRDRKYTSFIEVRSIRAIEMNRTQVRKTLDPRLLDLLAGSS